MLRTLWAVGLWASLFMSLGCATDATPTRPPTHAEQEQVRQHADDAFRRLDAERQKAGASMEPGQP